MISALSWINAPTLSGYCASRAAARAGLGAGAYLQALSFK